MTVLGIAIGTFSGLVLLVLIIGFGVYRHRRTRALRRTQDPMYQHEGSSKRRRWTWKKSPKIQEADGQMIPDIRHAHPVEIGSEEKKAELWSPMEAEKPMDPVELPTRRFSEATGGSAQIEEVHVRVKNEGGDAVCDNV
jgi:predicted lipid-binding transport protein (Tim44 family)